MAAILQGNNNNNFQHSLYVYIQEKHSYSGSKSREWALTHMQRKQHTHKQKFRRTDTFIPFWFDFHENVMSAQKASADADAYNTHSPNLHIHRQTGMHTWMSVCVCVEPPLAVSPTALLLLLLLPLLSCERASVFVDFGVYVGQQQQQQPNSGPWLRVYGARATFGRNSLKHTYMYARKHTHSFLHTHRHRALTCCTLHVLSLACCFWMLLPLAFVVAIAFSLLYALFRCNSLKFG